MQIVERPVFIFLWLPCIDNHFLEWNPLYWYHSRYIGLSSFVEYYLTSGFSLLSGENCASLPVLSCDLAQVLVWPSYLPSRQAPVPCLMRWASQQLLSVDLQKPVSCVAYLHLPGVNDFAVSLASLILLTVLRRPRPQLTSESNIFVVAVSLWEKNIKSLNEAGKDIEEVADTCDNTTGLWLVLFWIMYTKVLIKLEKGHELCNEILPKKYQINWTKTTVALLQPQKSKKYGNMGFRAVQQNNFCLLA